MVEGEVEKETSAWTAMRGKDTRAPVSRHSASYNF
jgi:hypothetical protein